MAAWVVPAMSTERRLTRRLPAASRTWLAPTALRALLLLPTRALAVLPTAANEIAALVVNTSLHSDGLDPAPPSSHNAACINLIASQCSAADYVAYVHINKAGGTSVADQLHNCNSERLLHARKNPKNKYHDPVSNYLQVMQERGIDPSKTFFWAATRNPYERLVSLFYYKVVKCLRTMSKDKCEGYKLPSYRTLQKSQGNDDEMVAHFQDWIAAMDAEYAVGSSENFQFSGNEDSERNDASATAWLDDLEKKAPDGFWFDFSLLDDIFPEIIKRCLPRCSKIATLEHENPSEHPPAALHFQGSRGMATAQIVERQMSRDFDMFGYQKGAYTGPPPKSGCGQGSMKKLYLN